MFENVYVFSAANLHKIKPLMHSNSSETYLQIIIDLSVVFLKLFYPSYILVCS